MNDHHDDFWGDVPAWDGSDRTRRTATSGHDSDHRKLGDRVRRFWTHAFGGGSGPEVTREHRIIGSETGARDRDGAGDTAHPANAAGDTTDPFGHAWDAWLDDWDEPTPITRSRDTSHRFDTPAVAVRPADDGPAGLRDTTPGPTDRVDDDRDEFDDAATDITDAFAAGPIDARRQRSTAGADPLLTRVGVLAIVTAIVVPFMLGAGRDGADLISQAEAVVSTSDAAPATATDPTTSAPPTAAAETSSTVEYLDPALLPPAVPVSRDADTGSGDESSDDTSSPTDTASTAAADLSAADALGTDPATSDTGSSTTESTGSTASPATGATTTVRSTTPPVSAAATGDGSRNCAIDYVVVAGDYWIRLADEAGVPLAELLEANGATVDTPLLPGRTICLPAGSATPERPPTAAETTTSTTGTSTTTSTTTSNTTSTTTTAPPAPPVDPPGPEEIKQIIRDVWPDDLEDRALEVAYRESRFVPTAKNFCCYGLFQIYWEVHRGWLADLGITSDQQLYDPETNARAAYVLYQRAGGWGPWGF